MPGNGVQSANMNTAREMLEACRFSYKMFAQSCTYPMDPFFESNGNPADARKRLMKKLHDEDKSRDTYDRELDPIEYNLGTAPDPSQGVVYRNDKDDSYILLQPRALDRSIRHYSGFDLRGLPLRHRDTTIDTAAGRARCGYFQGKTGMTKTHRYRGWPTFLGAVIYDPAKNRVTVLFRGSRSGDGTRALKGAKLHSSGSPDWITDMNMLKGEKADKFHNATMACGFYYAYESCKDSLIAAYRYAVGGAQPASIYFTGHSLGGALAQVAYLDFVCGDTARQIGGGLSGQRSVQCFPISAPPVIHGQASHHALSLAADVTQILHYFCPGDLVHCGPLVKPTLSLMSTVMNAGNKVMEQSHPLTSPVHLGCEIALPSDKGFPPAHEPAEVYCAMNGVQSDGDFWITFKFDPLAPTGPFVYYLSFAGQNTKQELYSALINSISPDLVLRRAMQWKEEIKNSGNANFFSNKSLDRWKAAVELAERHLAGGNVGNLPGSAKTQLRETREWLIKGAKESGSATHSAYWTLLQGLSALQQRME